MRTALTALVALIATPLLITALATAVLTGTGTTQPSAAATADIPPDYLRVYHAAAATCPGLHWAVLAAVGKIETDHGRSTLPGVHAGENPSGAAGPMQFLAPTFATVTSRHPPPPGGSTPPSRYNPHDAIHAAAAYLCDSGAPDRLDEALHTYNPSHAYVTDVLAQAERYSGTAPTSPTGGTTAARIALGYARAQLGLPYLWGGDGPANGEPGFDCSGLTTAAYAAAGITLPRTAHTQYLAGPLLPPGTPLQPGDLLFFGTPTHIHHVGIATGHGALMINAPHRGAVVRVQDAARSPDFLAASRPALGTTRAVIR